jgi:hypothetical protein
LSVASSDMMPALTNVRRRGQGGRDLGATLTSG